MSPTQKKKKKGSPSPRTSTSTNFNLETRKSHRVKNNALYFFSINCLLNPFNSLGNFIFIFYIILNYVNPIKFQISAQTHK